VALRAEVGELRGAVAPDLAQRALVLCAFRSAFVDSNFTAQDALEHAAEQPDGDCARALVPLLGGPVGGLRRLARRMAKLAGKPAGGLVLTRIGDDRGAALHVTQTSSSAQLSRPGMPPARYAGDRIKEKEMSP
jgi:hypothetical protein